EDRVKKLEEYMEVIMVNFIQLTSEVIRRLKENIVAEGSKMRIIEKITKYLDIEVLKPLAGDGGFNTGNTKVASTRDLNIKLAHWCIATTISGRKESTNRVTEIDLYYLYCIYTKGFICNIPYWLSKYLKSMREKNLIFGGSVCDFMKKSLIAMRVIMELHNGVCVWPTTREVEEDNEAEEEAEGEAANEGARGSVKMYQNMSQGDWHFCQARLIDQKDER
nr:hypothetical protein [Tanacetum cinerariifolium]